MLPQVNVPAPDFTLPDQNGQACTLKSCRGQWLLLYFYPKDGSAGCTKEACGVRDAFPDFEKHNLKVLGVSVDTVDSHKKFAGRLGLPFTILSDEGKEVVKQYGVWGQKSFLGRKYLGTLRTSFLIDPQGVVRKVYENVKPKGHADEVFRDCLRLQQGSL